MTPDVHDLDTVLRRAVSALNRAGIEDAAVDARVLAGAAFGLSREDMLRDPGSTLAPGAVAAFDGMIVRRAAREPVSRILGKREFRSLDFEICPATLDPRPDSEALVEAVLALANGTMRDLQVLDIGTGSGCLLLSVLHEVPSARGVGTDIDPDAIACAGRNAAALGLSGRADFIRTNWVDGIEEPFDIVLSNPPYIPSGDITGLAPDVAEYDPTAALDGGSDGLDAYRVLSLCVGRVLAPSGVIALEIGAGQGAEVEAIFASAHFGLADTRRDLAGRDRVLVFSRVARSIG
ncbi:MAG: peptide chain release factor N(5)-glutamine methyltransferase [Alphaproteobacteria bacterium]